MNPSEESFFASKTMILLALSMATIVLLVAAGILVKVLFHIDVFEMIAAGIAGVTGQSAQGTYRNVKTDTPLRQAQASPPPTQPPGTPEF